jgi:hypothetical protein
MRDFLLHGRRESSVFASSVLAFGVAAAQNLNASNSIWEDLDGDNHELYLASKKLLTGEQTSYWQHQNWGRNVEKELHEDCFHIRYPMSSEDFDALVQLLGDEVVPNFATGMSSLRYDEAPVYPEMMVAT